jgi:hypothetical protein
MLEKEGPHSCLTGSFKSNGADQPDRQVLAATVTHDLTSVRSQGIIASAVSLEHACASWNAMTR